jgi:hypothetical protein
VIRFVQIHAVQGTDEYFPQLLALDQEGRVWKRTTPDVGEAEWERIENPPSPELEKSVGANNTVTRGAWLDAREKAAKPLERYLIELRNKGLLIGDLPATWLGGLLNELGDLIAPPTPPEGA